MIKQPIALRDRLDGFGRSQYSYNTDKEKVFQPLDALTPLRTFRLRGSIGHCDFTVGILSFFAPAKWLLFKRFDVLQRYCADSIVNIASSNSPIVNNDIVELQEENVLELCESATDFAAFKRLCSSAPYVSVVLQNILRNESIGIFGVADANVDKEMQQLQCKTEKKGKRKAENSSTAVKKAKKTDAVAEDIDEKDSPETSPLRASIESMKEEIEAADHIVPELQVYGVKVSVYAHNDSFAKLFSNETTFDVVRAQVYKNLFDQASNGSLNRANSSTNSEMDRCNIALSVLFESMQSLAGNNHNSSNTQITKFLNLDYQPPLVEHACLFPPLTAEHGLRFELYDYQRRLLYWMLQRERQTLFFQAWPATALSTDNVAEKHLDDLTIPQSIVVPIGTSIDHNNGYLLPNGYLTFPRRHGIGRAEILRCSDDTLVKFSSEVFPQLVDSSHYPHKLQFLCQQLFGVDNRLPIDENFLKKGFLLSAAATVQIVAPTKKNKSSNTNNNHLVEFDEDDAEMARQLSNPLHTVYTNCSKNGLQATNTGAVTCHGNCSAVAEERAKLQHNLSVGTEHCPLSLLAEAFMRAAQVQNFLDRQQQMRHATRYLIVSNPQLFRCGVSCGQTGCGKTTMKIVLMYAMKRWEDAVPDSLRERAQAQNATSYEALLPPQRRPLMLSKNILNKTLVEERNALYYANCTLVICPEQVVEQWFMEFVKTIGRGTARDRPKTGKSRSVMHGGVFGEIVDENEKVLLHIAVLRDIHALRLVTLVDIIERIDVLIVNQNLFRSESYRSNTKTPINAEFQRTYNTNHHEKIETRIFDKPEDSKWIPAAVQFERNYIQKAEVALQERMLKSDNKDNFDYDSVPKPGFAIGRTLLHAIHYRRKIIDEAHLLSAHVTAVERGVAAVRADFTWCLTATANFDVQGAMRRVNVRNEGGYGVLLQIPNEIDRTILESNREYRCQFVNQCSATTSYDSLPKLHLHRVPVQMTPAEMAIYSSLNGGLKYRMLRLLFCSHHMLNNAQWMEKNLGSLLSNDNDENGGGGGAAAAAAITGKPMTVEEVANAMQARRLQEIISINDALLQTINDFRASWLALRDSVPDQELVDTATAEIEEEIAATEQLAQQAAERLQKDEMEQNEPHNLAAVEPLKHVAVVETLTHDYLGEIKTEMLDRWRTERDVRIAMALTRLEESISRAGISLRARYSVASTNRAPQLRQRERTLAEYNFFRNIFQRLSRPEESIECPVCLSDEHTKQAIVLTVCGHEFCTECSKDLFTKSKQCSVCRRVLVLPRDLRLVDRTPPVALPPVVVAPMQSGEKKIESIDVRETYGSKLASLVLLINQILRRRDCKKIVIFAQFQRLLLLISDVLQKSGIKFVVVQGSIRSCEKAFRAFRYDSSVKIILLASDKSISGVHLVEANHLIAVHPMLCSRGVEDEYAMLWQAIGRIRRLMQRSDCHVWQMVTQNTIEEQLYDSQTSVARQKQAMDVGIVWNAADSEEQTNAVVDLTNSGEKRILPASILPNTALQKNPKLSRELAHMFQHNVMEVDEEEDVDVNQDQEEDEEESVTEEVDDEEDEEEKEAEKDAETDFGEWLCTKKYRTKN